LFLVFHFTFWICRCNWDFGEQWAANWCC